MTMIVRVQNKKHQKEFIEFPRNLYAGEPNYISDLNVTVKNKLSKNNPFLKHSEVAMFMAKDSSSQKPLGRIAAIYNKTHLAVNDDNSGFFGFFDCIQDKEISDDLINTASEWLKDKGLKRMIGPTNLTTNNSCGILIQGFEYPNQVDMPYNHSYYSRLLEENGLSKVIDLYAYHLIDKPDLEKYSNLMSRAKSRLSNMGVRIRSITAKTFKSDIRRLRLIYNKCNREHWGFLPLNDEEFMAMAQDLKSIMPYKLGILAELNNEIVGYIIAVPDFNQVLKRIPNGKLWPYGIFKILKYRNKIDSARVMIIGVDPDLRGSGLDLILYQAITNALYDQNIFQCEPAYVMETNKTMNSLMVKIGGTIRKRYRLYKKSI
ncbi:MAG: hypothetical protein KJO00_12120 [Bacteroidia bacterium]|nr:hypothetical protein [Bacteroidia bacterium]MBT8288760.1 hypothetical protein [Bacteroidia bacterium]NNK72824.1 hypothetical protein [Flavobacteriaceae bacterium]